MKQHNYFHRGTGPANTVTQIILRLPAAIKPQTTLFIKDVQAI